MLVSGSGALVSPLINLASLPILLRIYGPGEYGLWALILSFALLPGNVATLRYELAVVLARDDREGGRTFGLCLWLVLACALLLVVGVLARPMWLPLFASLQQADRLLWFVPPLGLLLGLSLTATATCTFQKSFAYNSASLVVLAAVTNGLQIVLPRLGITGATGLLLGSLCGYAASASVLVGGIVRRSGVEFSTGLRTAHYGDLLRRHANFPRFSVPYSFVGTLRLEGVKLLFGAYGTSALVGDFAFAQRLTNFPVTLFGSGIRPVLFQRAARPGALPELEPLIRSLLLWLSLLMVPLVVVFEVQAEAIFAVVAGERWLGAVPFARVLILPAVILLHAGWLDRLFDVQGRQRLALVLQLVFTLLSLAALAMGLRLAADPLRAVAAQSVVLGIYYVLLVVVAYRVAGYGLGRLWLAAGFPLVVALLELGGWWGLRSWLGDWSALLATLATVWGAGVWFLLAVAARPVAPAAGKRS